MIEIEGFGELYIDHLTISILTQVLHLEFESTIALTYEKSKNNVIRGEPVIPELLTTYLDGINEAVECDENLYSTLNTMYTLYRSVILKVYNGNNDTEYLDDCLRFSGNDDRLFALIYIMALRKDDYEIYKILYDKNLLGEYNISKICHLIVSNIFVDNEFISCQFSILFTWLKKCVELTEDNILEIGVFEPSHKIIDIFSKYAEKYNSKVKIKLNTSKRPFPEYEDMYILELIID